MSRDHAYYIKYQNTTYLDTDQLICIQVWYYKVIQQRAKLERRKYGGDTN